MACLAATAVATADTVRLNNGDVLSGTVLSSDEQTVRIAHPVLGEITLPRDQVAAIEPTADAPAAVAAEATEQAPSSDTAPAGDETNQAAPATPAPAAEPLPPPPPPGLFGTGLFVGWDHSLALGFSGSSGNSDNSNLTAQFKTSFKDDDDRWLIDTRYYLANDSGRRTENEFRANLTRDWLQRDSDWFYFTNASYEYDQFEAWEHRTSVFGGLGRTWIDKPTVEFNTRLGAGVTYEFGTVNELTPEALFGASLIRWNITDRQTLTASNTLYPDLGDLGKFRNVSAIEYKLKIDQADGVSIKLGLENEYESNPENDDERNDLKYYGALVVDF